MEIAESHKKVEQLEAQLKEAQERLDCFDNLNQSLNDSIGTSVLQVLCGVFWSSMMKYLQDSLMC